MRARTRTHARRRENRACEFNIDLSVMEPELMLDKWNCLGLQCINVYKDACVRLFMCGSALCFDLLFTSLLFPYLN